MIRVRYPAIFEGCLIFFVSQIEYYMGYRQIWNVCTKNFAMRMVLN